MPTFPEIDNSWTLFLDRDGVINKRIVDGYVLNWSMFEWLPGSKEAIVSFADKFRRIVVVTNQQGIGKGLMSEEDLNAIHDNMREEIHLAGGRIDGIFFCPDLAQDDPACRKPNIGMFKNAQRVFPGIDASKSIMAGDSVSDIAFGKNASMITVGIETEKVLEDADFHFPDLKSFSESLFC